MSSSSIFSSRRPHSNSIRTGPAFSSASPYHPAVWTCAPDTSTSGLAAPLHVVRHMFASIAGTQAAGHVPTGAQFEVGVPRPHLLDAFRKIFKHIDDLAAAIVDVCDG